MPHLEFSTLGPLQATLDGDSPPSKLLWKKHVALLVYLKRSPTRSHTREKLVGLLWPEAEETRARHSLRQAVRLIRECCGDNSIETDATNVELAQETLALDVDRAEELSAREDWDELLRIWRGEFMEGFSVPDSNEFDSWLAAERRQITRDFLTSFVEGAESKLDAGDFVTASRLAQKALTIDPTSEPAVECAMKAAALLGQRGTAIDLYRSFVSEAEELGIEPADAVEELAHRVTSETRWARAIKDKTDVEIEADRPPLAGRTTELARMMEGWRAAIDRPVATAVLVEGDPGSGRSRLAEEFGTRMRLEGAFVAGMRVVASDLDTPWSGINTMARAGLENAPGVGGADPEAIAAFASLSEDWADRFPTAARDRTGGNLQQPLREVLRAGTEEHPVALVFDGAEHLDEHSLKTIDYLLRELADRPLLIAAFTTSEKRRTELDALRSAIGRDVPGVFVELGSLDERGMRELVTWAVPDYTEEERERLVRRVLIDSAGLPLLAVEVLQAVREGMSYSSDGGAWPRPLQTLDQSMPADLPGNVVGAVRVRYGCLSANGQKLLNVAAILEPPVREAQFLAAGGLDNADTCDALDELEWTRWLVSDTRGYSFTARIVRDIVSDDMVTEGLRRRVTRAAAN